MVTHSFCKAQLELQKVTMNLVLNLENIYMPKVHAIHLPLLQYFWVFPNIVWIKACYQAVTVFHLHNSSFPDQFLGFGLKNRHMKFSAICWKDGAFLKMQMGEIFLSSTSFIYSGNIKSLETARFLLSSQFVFISLTSQIPSLIAFPFLPRLLESSEPNLRGTWDLMAHIWLKKPQNPNLTPCWFHFIVS